MLPLKLAIFFAVSSLLTLHGCGAKLDVEVCISDPEEGGMQCEHKKEDRERFLSYAKTDKYICHSPEDTRTLLNYCKELRDGPHLSGVDVDVCVSDPQSGGMQCDKSGFRVYEKTEKYVCFSPVDYRTLVEFCREGGDS